jgi:geranylgeranyl diphosphate synthase, type I
MNAKETIALYKDRIDSRLRKFLSSRVQRAKRVSPRAAEMMQHILEFNMRGGKRIRPILVVFGYKAAGGKDEPAILDAAIAVELMEGYLLIHDDIMDQDELRRGYLTMHRIFENRSRERYQTEDHSRFGESMAIIAGDIAAVMGSEAILGSDFPAERKLVAVDKFNRAVVNTCFGQLLDLESVLEPSITEDDVRRLHTLKTAVYTIEAPLHIGAVLAGATDKELKVLSNYAIPLGRAFQIQDDILGLFGSQKKIGKPVGSDIREGKRTFLIIKALERAKTTDRRFLQACLGHKDITEEDVARVQKIVTDTGSLEYSQREVRSLISESLEVIRESRLRPEGRDFLIGLADFLLSREH